MKILIVANHYPVASGRYAADAFCRLGHDVRTIGPHHLNHIWGMTVDEKYIWKITPPEVGWTPDLGIIMDSDSALIDYRAKLHPTKTIVWGVDNHVRDYRWAHVDHYFLAHKNVTQQPFDETTTWLPCCYDPTIFTPSPIPWDKREYDVCMIGVMYPRRATLVNLLRAHGFKVRAEMGLLYEECRDAYHNSRISLCVSANGDVAQRIFETGAMGNLVLTDPLHDLVNVQTGERPETSKALGLAGFSVYNSDLECLQMVERWIHEAPDIAEQGARAMQKACQRHTWDARAQVIVDWFEGKQREEETPVLPTDAPVVVDVKDNLPEIAAPEPEKKPYLNLGCGKTHFPSAPPRGHELVPPEVYAYPLWLNIDKNEGGADKVFDLFTYPWPLPDNSYDGVVMGHIAEHIPHEIKVHEERLTPPGIVERGGAYFDEKTGQRVKVDFDETRNQKLRKMQDGWYAFFAELWRVLTPGAKVHIVSPFGWTDGAITDPSHTRMLTAHTFTHALAPENNGGETFSYEVDCNFKMAQMPAYRVTEPFLHLLQSPTDTADESERKQREFHLALMTRINVVYDIYVVLEAVK